MSGRGERGRGRGGGRGRGEPGRGGAPAYGQQRGGGPPQGGRGTGPPSRGPPSGFRGGPGPRGGPRGGSAFTPPPPPVAPPPLGPATLDQRISTIQKGVEKFKNLSKAPEHPLRPGFGTAGTSITVRANFFALKFAKNLIIHEYKIEITPKTDLARLKGRIIESLEQSPQYAQYKPFVAHDKSEKLVAARALPQPLIVEVNLIEEGETSARPNARKYRVEITKTVELDTNDLSKCVLTCFLIGDLPFSPGMLTEIQPTETSIPDPSFLPSTSSSKRAALELVSGWGGIDTSSVQHRPIWGVALKRGEDILRLSDRFGRP
jgi:eukaryotic translation initiation factor 2C